MKYMWLQLCSQLLLYSQLFSGTKSAFLLIFVWLSLPLFLSAAGILCVMYLEYLMVASYTFPLHFIVMVHRYMNYVHVHNLYMYEFSCSLTSQCSQAINIQNSIWPVFRVSKLLSHLKVDDEVENLATESPVIYDFHWLN